MAAVFVRRERKRVGLALVLSAFGCPATESTLYQRKPRDNTDSACVAWSRTAASAENASPQRRAWPLKQLKTSTGP